MPKLGQSNILGNWYTVTMKNAVFGPLLSLTLLCSWQPRVNRKWVLAQDFMNPTASAKAKTWLHAMSGNRTTDLLAKDAASMAKVGAVKLFLCLGIRSIPIGAMKYGPDKHHQPI